ncbi:aminoglycoside 6-adenylyltransferase [Streptomyces sp. NPDC049577]|uniref:aminoglycoside 6-adenylyltransferase n=1 Tax=Streptomyces sp. NPDC049577 TaxID=3155153 RepID=UPI003442DD23
MEDPDKLLRAVLDFASRQPGIDAVVQTGSRARGLRVDEWSDLDIELIGPGAVGLAGSDTWQEEIAPTLLSVHLANEGEDEPDWPTCLVVFAEGRKVDFTLAGPERLEAMKRDGLDDLYGRGYVVHLDRTGVTEGLSPSHPAPPAWTAPGSREFEENQREFWFEATQVPVYAARGDLWPAASRLAEMRELLLTMLEWYAGARSGGRTDTWYGGHHLAEWLGDDYRDRIPDTFARYDAADIVRALRATAGLYADAAAATGRFLSLPVLDLRDRVLGHVDGISRGVTSSECP